RYGSTAEVADVIATTLRARNLAIDVAPISEITNLDAYYAIIIGTPLYIGKWPNAVHRFLKRNRNVLNTQQVAIFTLGPIKVDLEEMQQAQKCVEKELERYEWLQPTAKVVFTGKYDPAKLNFQHKVLAKLPASPLYDLPKTDNRNWHAIRFWAEHMADQLVEMET
ncbi:MAG: flavodoxin domain-containing protein, partial [Bacteroidota bacterium]